MATLAVCRKLLRASSMFRPWVPEAWHWWRGLPCPVLGIHSAHDALVHKSAVSSDEPQGLDTSSIFDLIPVGLLSITKAEETHRHHIQFDRGGANVIKAVISEPTFQCLYKRMDEMRHLIDFSDGETTKDQPQWHLQTG